MVHRSAVRSPVSLAAVGRALLAVATGMALSVPWAGGAQAQQTLLDGSVSYSFTGQSMWGPGDAFIFEDATFVGIDSNPAPVVIGAGSGDRISVGSILGTYTLDPYFQFDTDFRLGVELGASVNSGSVDGNLDYAVSLTTPGPIRVGEAFSLVGSATPLGSSSFVTRSPTAGAYVDGILETWVGGYARFDYVAPGVLADHDFRWGNKGFTDNNTTNAPYATLANIVAREELIGVNRDASGVVKYFAPTGDLFDGDLLYDQVGKGSSVSAGPVTLTAGNIDVVANGVLAGASLVGAGADTMASMLLDIDHMLLGTPALGLSIGHDWGIVDYDLGYDIVDLDATLDILFEQSFELKGDVLVDLSFSTSVLIDGIGLTDHYLGPIDAIPLLTLLTNRVDVEAMVLVEALFTNDSSLGFLGALVGTVLEAHALVGYDVGGQTGSFGRQVGPVWSATLPIDLGSIGVYSDTFSLGLLPVGSWSFSLVPEPGAGGLLILGALGLYAFGTRRPGLRP